MLACVSNNSGQCNVGGWKLFDRIDRLEDDIRDRLAKEEAMPAQHRREIEHSKGLFAMKRRRELSAAIEDSERIVRRLQLHMESILRSRRAFEEA